MVGLQADREFGLGNNFRASKCPPGVHMAPPPGLQQPLQARESELAEMHRLREMHQQIMNERLELKTTLMVQENALLRAQLRSALVTGGMPLPMPSGALGTPQAPPGCWRAQKMASRCSPDIGSDSSDGSTPVTTILVRNIPSCYTRDGFLRLLDTECFQGLYDLVYLPIDFTTRSGYGYAFINCTCEDAAGKFRDHFDGFTNWGVSNEKACDVSGVAVHQGLVANIQRYRNSPMMHESVLDEFRPVVFEDGVRVPFPFPTRNIKAPDVRHRSSIDREQAVEP